MNKIFFTTDNGEPTNLMKGDVIYYRENRKIGILREDGQNVYLYIGDSREREIYFPLKSSADLVVIVQLLCACSDLDFRQVQKGRFSRFDMALQLI